MTKQVQFRRGTTAQHSSFTGALAEITVDTNKKTAIVHDGTQVGGFPLVGSFGGTFTFTSDLDLIPAATKTLSLRGGNGATASLTFDASNNAQFFHDLTIGNADTDNLTLNSQFVTGTKLKTAKSVGNTLAISAYDVDGTSYTDLVTVTAGNTPTIAITSTGVGSINNINIGGTTRGTGAFTTLDANGNVTLGDAAGDTVTVNGTTTFNAPVSFSGGTSHLTLTGELRGPATFILDPAAVGDDTGLVRIKGDLEVLGTTTTINSTVTTIADPTIELRRGNSLTAADGGVQVNLTTNGSGVVQTFQRLQWNNGSTRWETTDGTTAKPILNTVDAQTITGNRTFSGNLTADGNNAAVNFSPTGTGSVTINPATAGNINRMNIGATTRGTGAFTTLDANSTVGLSGANAQITISPTGTGSVTINPATAGSIDRMNIGTNTRATGYFTVLEASGSVQLNPFNTNVLIQPTGTGSVTISPVTAGNINNMNIGASTRGTGAFTTLDANSTVTLSPSANVTISPTGSGTVSISPAGGLTINPAGTSNINNVAIGASTASTGRFTTLEVRDITTTSQDLFLASNSTVALTADRTLTFNVRNADRTISLGGNFDIGGAFSYTPTNGSHALTVSVNAPSTVTFPSGTVTLVDLSSSQNLTNKTCSFPTSGNSITSKAYVDAMVIAFGC